MTNYSGADRFSYTVRDVFGGEAAADVLVNVIPKTEPAIHQIVQLAISPTQVSMSLLGIPGQTYTLERTANLHHWKPVASAIAPPDGIVNLTDPNPPAGTAFYRVVTQ